MVKRKKDIRWHKDALAGVVCVLVYSFVFLAIKTPLTASIIQNTILSFRCDMSAERATLAPTIRLKPMIDIEKKGDKYVIIETDPSEDEPLRLDYGVEVDSAKRTMLEEGFKEDVAFMYVTRLIGRALHLGISAQGLREMINEHLAHIDFRGYLWDKLYKKGGMFCIPYRPKYAATDKVNLMKFYLDDGTPAVFPEQILLVIGDVRVIMEDPLVSLAELASDAGSFDSGLGDVMTGGTSSEPDNAVMINIDISAERIRSARNEFNEINEKFRQLENERERSHRDERAGRPAPYYGLANEAERLRKKLENWRVRWASGFGVDKEAKGIVKTLDEMAAIIKGSGMKFGRSTGKIYYELNGPFNTASVYFLNLSVAVNSAGAQIDVDKFMVPAGDGSLAAARADFEVLENEFRDLQKIRERFQRLDGDRLDNFRTVWDHDIRHATDLAAAAARLRVKLEKWNVLWGERTGTYDQVGSIITALEEIESATRKSDLFSGGTANLRELYYRLNTPFNHISVLFMNALYDNAWRLAEEREGSRKDAQVPDLESSRKAAVTLMDTLKLRAFEARKAGQNMILGIDTSWIPGMDGEQGMAIQPLLSEIYRLSKEEGLENIIIVRGEGPSVARDIFDKAHETGTALSNVIVLGGEKTIRSEEFSGLKSTDTERRAFLAGVDPKNLTENSYARIVEMCALAIKLAFSDIDSVSAPKIQANKVGPRVWVFIPEAEPFDLRELKKIYGTQRQALIAA